MPSKTNKNKSAVATTGSDVPAYLRNQGPARGSENVGQEDIVIPRLELVQDLSGYVKKNDPQYNPDAEAGMIVNTVTMELFPALGVLICPVVYSRHELLWIPRAKGGGFRGSYATKAEAREAADLLEEMTEMVSTPQHLCLHLVKGKPPAEVVISMPKTKEKISRRLNTLVRLAESDRFSRCYRLGSVQESGAKGDYYNFSIESAGFPDEGVYRLAEALYESISSGDRTVNVHVDADNKEGGDDGEF